MTLVRPGHHRRLSAEAVALIAIALVALLSLFAFNKLLFNLRPPWAGDYEVQAIFASGQSIRAGAQGAAVRIAGVNVGEVTDVRGLSPRAPELEATEGRRASQVGPAALVTMRIEDQGRPLREDATFKLRPRLFLEGNLFVDVKPGSPNASEAGEDHVFPIDQTSVSVQLDELLTTLQADVRSHLQKLLEQLGSALVERGGAEGLRDFFRTSPGAFRYSAQVSEALLGTERHDLSGLITNLDRVFRGLARNEGELSDLVSNLNATTGALAAENEALRRGVAELPGALDAAEPALASVDSSLPAVRALAREALPGVRSAPASLDAAIPFTAQLRRLASESELRGVLAELRPTVPALARLTDDTRGLFEQLRPLSSCANQVLIPFQNDRVSSSDPLYPHQAAGEVYKELGYSLVGAGAESRSGDANGQYVRTGTGSGSNIVVLPPSAGHPEEVVGLSSLPLLGSMPSVSSSAKTPYRPDVPCETQEPPHLDGGGIGPSPEQSRVRTLQATQLRGPVGDAARRLERIILDPLERAATLLERGDRAGALAAKRRVADRYGRFLRSGFDPLARAIRELGGRGR